MEASTLKYDFSYSDPSHSANFQEAFSKIVSSYLIIRAHSGTVSSRRLIFSGLTTRSENRF